MKPNGLGGQTLEHNEIYACLEGLAAAGQIGLSDQLAAQVKTADEKRVELAEKYEGLDPSTMVHLYGNAYMSVRGVLRSQTDELELSPTHTGDVLAAMAKAVKGDITISQEGREIAQSILDQYYGKVSRVRRALSAFRLTRLPY